jgi:hypothetical protein
VTHPERQEISMPDPADLLLRPDTVDAFYADRGCSLRSAATLTTWGYTYRKLQRLHPGKPVGGFTTDDLVAFVTQRGWDSPRWSTATARNYRVAMQSLFGGYRSAGSTVPERPSGTRVAFCSVRSTVAASSVGFVNRRAATTRFFAHTCGQRSSRDANTRSRRRSVATASRGWSQESSEARSCGPPPGALALR